MDAVAQLEREFADLEARLGPELRKPIAFESVKDFPPKDWVSPLDRTGVRTQSETLAETVEHRFALADERERLGIRRLYARYPAVRWSVIHKVARATAEERLRSGLMRLSMTDGSGDYRDDILAVDAICARAEADGLAPGAILNEVAAISGEGVARTLLAKASRTAGRP